MNLSAGSLFSVLSGDAFFFSVCFCRELEEYKEKQDDNQNGGDAAKISSKHVGIFKKYIYKFTCLQSFKRSKKKIMMPSKLCLG